MSDLQLCLDARQSRDGVAVGGGAELDGRGRHGLAHRAGGPVQPLGERRGGRQEGGREPGPGGHEERRGQQGAVVRGERGGLHLIQSFSSAEYVVSDEVRSCSWISCKMFIANVLWN